MALPPLIWSASRTVTVLMEVARSSRHVTQLHIVRMCLCRPGFEFRILNFVSIP